MLELQRSTRHAIAEVDLTSPNQIFITVLTNVVADSKVHRTEAILTNCATI